MTFLATDNINKNLIPLIKNKNIALLAHPASVNTQFQHTLELLHQSKETNLKILFGPEHGLMGFAQDMEGVQDEPDPLTGLKSISLYGSTYESLFPKEEDLEGIDAVICDLQDIGARYYTYIYTLSFMMKVASKNGIKIIVIDRPNPIGSKVEGSLLQKGFESFVGFYQLPVRHGMTIGELALYFNEEENIHCDLEVLKFEKTDTSPPWIHPSPNMPTLDAAIVYPGMCLLEATEISEARGTTKPFEMFGAPFIDPIKLTKALNDLKLEGVTFRSTSFKPTFQKHAFKICHGSFIHVTNQERFNAYKTGLAIVYTLHSLYPNDFKWRHKPYEFVDIIPAIDLLTGSDFFRISLENNTNLSIILDKLVPTEQDFLVKRKKYLLYSEL